MNLFPTRCWSTALPLLFLLFVNVFPSIGHAQDVNAGKLVYTTPQVQGQLSCSAGACHTPNPLNNQNKILKAADNPGAIGVALNNVSQMAFLKGRLVTQQFIDVAAYIGNPAAALGAPTAQLSPLSLSFPATTVGNAASPQGFSVSNSGTAALIVGAVTSSNPEFSVVSTCGTIAVGTSCNISVGFRPTTTGSRSGTISVSHNGAGGSSLMTLTGSASAPLEAGIQVTPASLDFGAIFVESVSETLPVLIRSTGTAPLVITGLANDGRTFGIPAITCVVDLPIPPGGSCGMFIRFAPSEVGVQNRTLSISHNAGTAPATVTLRGNGVTGSLNTRTMVEYFYAPLNYFFITSRDDEKSVLDRTAGFQRTGLSFPVFSKETPGTKAISRFFFDKIAVQEGRGSHFYTLSDNDKAALIALNPTNAQIPRLPFNEGIDSWAFLPLVSGPGGSCPGGQIPVYRLFRGGTRFPDDPNHRFTANLATYESYISLGWDGEGVNFCVTQQ